VKRIPNTLPAFLALLSLSLAHASLSGCAEEGGDAGAVACDAGSASTGGGAVLHTPQDASSFCPWPSQGGVAACETVPNLTLPRCGGGEAELHELCGSQVALIFDFHGW